MGKRHHSLAKYCHPTRLSTRRNYTHHTTRVPLHKPAGERNTMSSLYTLKASGAKLGGLTSSVALLTMSRSSGRLF